MENLTKHQIILLTLLVSFVTSIATGIVTVALMNQAPIGVSQTINRVVEHTIEQVVATSTLSSRNDQQPTVKETIVVSEDDQVVSAINGNTKSVVRIYARGVDQSTGLPTTNFVALGGIIASDGTIATDNGVIFPNGKYFMKTDDGTSYDLNVLEAAQDETIALLKVVPAGTSTPVFSNAKLAANDLQLGQAVVYIGGAAKNSVATGIVSSLGTKTITASSTSATSTPPQTQTVVASVQTSIPSDNFTPGGLLFDLSGELVGIKSAYATSDTFFAPTGAIQNALASVQK